MNIFLSRKAPPGYGPRIFVGIDLLEKFPKLETLLDSSSCWGGCDKEGNNYKSWELKSKVSNDLSPDEFLSLRGEILLITGNVSSSFLDYSWMVG